MARISTWVPFAGWKTRTLSLIWMSRSSKRFLVRKVFCTVSLAGVSAAEPILFCAQIRLAIKTRIILGHELEAGRYRSLWCDIREGRTRLSCVGFKYTGYNLVFLKHLQALDSNPPSYSAISMHDVHSGRSTTIHSLSAQSRRLLGAYDGALSAAQRFGADVASHGPAVLIDTLRKRTQDVVDDMMEERVVLLSQIQELKAKLGKMDAKAGNSLPD